MPDLISYWHRRWHRHFDRPSDLLTFLSIGAALLLAPWVLARFGLPRTLAHLHRRVQQSQDRPAVDPDDIAATLAESRRLARYADLWLHRLHLRNPCLRRTLVLFGRLRRDGLPVDFCLGVRADATLRDQDPLQGHAWLELEGQTFLESPDSVERHVSTFRYP